MGKRVDAFNEMVKMFAEQSKDINIFTQSEFSEIVKIGTLSNIALSLAVIADKMTEDDNADNE